MAPGDWVELLTGSQGNGVAAFAVLLTMLSGYMVIAYVVGATLTRMQLALANTLYLVGALTMLAGIRTSMMEANTAREHLSSLVEEIDYAGTLEQAHLISDLVVAVDVALIIAPLIFMWQIRHFKTK
jgi:hypothetical protein